MQSKEPERLNKVLALRLGIGRREADILIERGRVQVNGQAARLGQRVIGQEPIEVNGKPVTTEKSRFIYILLDKPVGYVSSRAKQGNSPTIYSLLPTSYHHLKPVGRLDKDSSGLLLMTNDGDLALRMTHPRFGKKKLYEVTLDQPLSAVHRQTISTSGVELADGQSIIALRPQPGRDEREWLVTMSEGRNRQIRRTFAALGYTVVKLRRIEFGPWGLEALNGKPFRILAEDRVAADAK